MSDDARRESYERISRSVGLLEFPDRGIVRLTGSDAVTFLQGLVTNDLAGLAPAPAVRPRS